MFIGHVYSSVLSELTHATSLFQQMDVRYVVDCFIVDQSLDILGVVMSECFMPKG